MKDDQAGSPAQPAKRDVSSADELTGETRSAGHGWLRWLTRSRWRRLVAPIGYSLVIALVVLTLGALRAFGSSAPGRSAASPTTGASRAATSATPTRHTATPTTPTGAASPTAGLLASDTCSLTSDAVAAETFLLNLLNRHRADAHAPPLSLNPRLTAISHAHSCDMFQRQRIDHLGSDGSTPEQRIATLGVPINNWGENIGNADGYGLDGGITTIDTSMMAEPLTPYDHHYNIVNRAFSEVGLGIIYANGQVWFTEDFLG